MPRKILIADYDYAVVALVESEEREKQGAMQSGVEERQRSENHAAFVSFHRAL